MDRDLRVCFVGDSFVAGTGDSSALGWVGRVIAAGNRAGMSFTGYNLGVRRDTSILVRARIGSEVQVRLEPATDPRVVISFGVNDTSIAAGRQRVDARETVHAFQQSCEAVTPARVAFVTAPAVDNDEHNKRINTLNQLLAREAAQIGVPVIDTFDATRANDLWRRQVHQGDGFHPDVLGYEYLAEIVTDRLLDWLRYTKR